MRHFANVETPFQSALEGQSCRKVPIVEQASGEVRRRACGMRAGCVRPGPETPG